MVYHVPADLPLLNLCCWFILDSRRIFWYALGNSIQIFVLNYFSTVLLKIIFLLYIGAKLTAHIMNSSSKTIARHDVLTVTPEFKKEAAKSIIAIVGFILVYLLLFALSIGIVVMSVYGGIAIIACVLRFIPS